MHSIHSDCPGSNLSDFSQTADVLLQPESDEEEEDVGDQKEGDNSGDGDSE
jgi:hypothetical protein